MKPKKPHHFLFSVLLIGIFLIAPPLFIMDHASNKPAIRNYCHQTELFIDRNQAHLETIFTQTFDQAGCQSPECRAELSRQIHYGLTGQDELLHFPSTYFIRLKSPTTIEKLFLSGEYQTKTAETAKEAIVVQLLQGNRGRICDQGWKLDGGTTTMRYLRDIWSEAEIIIPVTKNGQVMGAIVKAWGD